VFGLKRDDEVTGGWRKLHNEEPYNLYFFAKYNWNDQVKEGEMDSTCSMQGERGMHTWFWWESQMERNS
jgi:hypothetical protein